MADIYEMLIGAPPSNEEELRATAEQLRRRKLQGQLGILTGDPMIGKVGAGMTKDVGSEIEQLQGSRQKDAQRDLMSEYYGNQAENWKNNYQLERDKHDYDTGELKHRRALELAVSKGSGGSGGKPPRLRIGDIKTLQETAGALGTIRSSKQWLEKDDSFNPGQMKIAGIPVWGGRSMANYMASQGFGTEDSKRVQAFWQNYARHYELAERNALFGATLTTNELRSWASANPSKEMTREQIMAGMEILDKIYSQRLNNFKAGLNTEGYSQEAIDNYTALPVYDPVGQAPNLASGTINRSNAPSQSGAQPKSGKRYVQGQGWVE